MRNKFIWAYRLSPDEVKGLFDRCQFFFDTNTLLHLFRIKKEVANKAVKAISKYKDRISIPFHVAEEYHWHIVEILADRIAKTQSLISKLDENKVFGDIFTSTLTCYFPPEDLKPYRELVSKFCHDATDMLNKRLEEYNHDFNNMEIANSLSNELSGCILPSLSDDEIAKLKEEFPKRADNEIPPGYKDRSKEESGKKRLGQTNEAGDYIIWEEILRWAAASKKDVILVSNENKSDWIWNEHGFTIGPRWELRKEFHERSGGKLFHIIRLDEFIRMTDDKGRFSSDELDAMTDTADPVIIPSKKIKTISFDEIDDYCPPKQFSDCFSPVGLSFEERMAMRKKISEMPGFMSHGSMKNVWLPGENNDGRISLKKASPQASDDIEEK